MDQILPKFDPSTHLEWTEMDILHTIYRLSQAQPHTAGSDTIFVQIYMDPPSGAPGVSKDAPGSTKHAMWGLVR